MIGNRNKPWFGRHGYGSRNVPISWEGWLATLLYAVGVACSFIIPPVWEVPHDGLVAFAGFVLVTIAFAYVCMGKSRDD